MRHVYIGTSGYNYKDWKSRFYTDIAQKDWLMYYSLFFNTVEINATFYRSFPKSDFEKWHDITSGEFTFAVKGPRLITHYQKLHHLEDSLHTFLDSISGLKDKLAIVLWQFPVQFKRSEENQQSLVRFLELLQKKSDEPSKRLAFDGNEAGCQTVPCEASIVRRLRQTYDTKRYGHRNPLPIDEIGFHNVFEFRDASWFTDEIYSLLNNYKAGFVINDTGAFYHKEVVTDSLVYIRFHGPKQLYASSYSDTQLKYWAEKIKGYGGKVDIYCYFNNDISGYAIENAMRLRELVEK